jgi:hypothetical protein
VFRFTGRVQYADGSIAEFEAGNAALAAWERYAMRNKLPMGQDSPPTMSSLVIAHHALGVEQGIDAWIESVEGIELDADSVGEETAAADPIPLEASTGSP